MEISEIITKSQDSNVSKATVINWLNTVTPTRELISVKSVRIGDTFWHKLVGGKHRPWVVLSVTGKGDERVATAASLTHTDLECGFPSKCRYWHGVFIGSTVTSIPECQVKNHVYYPYTNTKHLKEVRQSFRDRLGV